MDVSSALHTPYLQSLSVPERMLPNRSAPRSRGRPSCHWEVFPCTHVPSRGCWVERSVKSEISHHAVALLTHQRLMPYSLAYQPPYQDVSMAPSLPTPHTQAFHFRASVRWIASE